MAAHFSVLAWKNPWTMEPGRLQTMGSQRVGHDRETSLSLSNYGGDNEDNGNSLKRSCSCTATLSAPNPVSRHHLPTPLESPLDCKEIQPVRPKGDQS